MRLSSAISSVHQYVACLFPGVFFRGIHASLVRRMTRIPADEFSSADRWPSPDIFISLYLLRIIRPNTSVFSLAVLNLVSLATDCSYRGCD